MREQNFNFLTVRIHFDEKMRSKLPQTLAEMKKVLYQIPRSRKDVPRSNLDYGWIMDFTPNSIANIALRKTDMTNFALNNEGNHYNNLFYKVLGLVCLVLSFIFCLFAERLTSS